MERVQLLAKAAFQSGSPQRKSPKQEKPNMLADRRPLNAIRYSSRWLMLAAWNFLHPIQASRRDALGHCLGTFWDHHSKDRSKGAGHDTPAQRSNIPLYTRVFWACIELLCDKTRLPSVRTRVNFVGHHRLLYPFVTPPSDGLRFDAGL